MRSRKVGQFQAQITRIGGVSHADFEVDDPLANQSFDFAIKVLHAFGRADAHCVEQGLAFAFALSTYSRVRNVDLRISTAATRPLPSFRGTRRCDTM